MWHDVIEFRTMTFEIMGTSPQPMKCFRSWFCLPGIGHGGGDNSLWGILFNPMVSLYRRAPSLFLRGTWFLRETPKTLWIDPDWSLYRTELNPRVAPGKTRKLPSLFRLTNLIYHQVLQFLFLHTTWSYFLSVSTSTILVQVTHPTV